MVNMGGVMTKLSNWHMYITRRSDLVQANQSYQTDSIEAAKTMSDYDLDYFLTIGARSYYANYTITMVAIGASISIYRISIAPYSEERQE